MFAIGSYQAVVSGMKQAEYEKRLRADGQKRVSFWMDQSELDRLDAALKPEESRAAFLKAAALKALEERD